MQLKNRRVLVAGGTGLVGIQLVQQLLELGAKIRIASLDDPSRANPEAEFIRLDLSEKSNCLRVCQGIEYVFNLLCTKGSPKIAAQYPVEHMSMNKYNSCLIEAAYESGAEGFLFTSSNGVYSPTELMSEDMVWKSYPSPNDRFAGYVKRVGELYADAYRIQYCWQTNIVRPANIYGPFDNFDSVNAMVVPSLIKRAVNGENPFVVWGDGNAKRDFIHAKDVARGMILVAQENPGQPVNLGSGVGTSIRELVETVIANITKTPKVIFDTTQPTGDAQRVLDIRRAKSLGFDPQITLADGIRETMEWYRRHKDQPSGRYDVFDKFN